MKVFSNLLIFTLILSVFSGCSKDDENLPLEGVAGTYMGSVSVSNSDPFPNVPLTITYKSAGSAELSVGGAMFGFEEDVKAQCIVTSSKDSYSLTGTGVLGNVDVSDLVGELPELPEGVIPSLEILIHESSRIDASGNANIVMGLSVKLPITGVPEIPEVPITFEGKRQ
jgi:hypothetical protein